MFDDVSPSPRTDRIVICEHCAGCGVVDRMDGHPHKPEYTTEVCPKCKGTGRLLRTVEISERPYRGEGV